MSTHIERTIGDPKGITRREALIGAAVALGSIIAASAIGGAFIGTYNKVKEYIGSRTSVLYANDAARAVRVSHANPEIVALYEQYLSPGSVIPARTELSHRLCHTVYGDDVVDHISKLQNESVEDAKRKSTELMQTVLG